MLWGYARWHELLRKAGRWMSDSDLQELRSARDAMLGLNLRLSRLAWQRGKALYPMKPKHHMLSHAEKAAQETKLNPGSHWAFAEEDNMGLITRICAACHNDTMHTRALQRWCLQFFWDLDR